MFPAFFGVKSSPIAASLIEEEIHFDARIPTDRCTAHHSSGLEIARGTREHNA